VTNVVVSVLLGHERRHLYQLTLGYGFSMTMIGLLAPLFPRWWGFTQMPWEGFCDCWNMPKTAASFRCGGFGRLVALYPFMNGALMLGF
jgi:hypothetical protein